MAGVSTYAQGLMDARAVGIGAYSGSVQDSRSFLSNPAGLVGMRDWMFNTTSYLPTTGTINGFVFQGFALGKRFLDDHAVAVQYSPGASLEFILPTNIILGNVNQSTSLDKRIRYDEQFALGYAWRALPELSLGTAVRLRDERVTDTQLGIQDTVFVVSTEEYETSAWITDAGIQWQVQRNLSLSLTARNLFSFAGSDFPAELASLALPDDPVVGAGVLFHLNPSLRLAAQLDTDLRGAAGWEWRPADAFALRGGLYMEESASPFLSGVSVGAGWSYEFFEASVAYLRFVKQDLRQGTTSAGRFDPSSITDLDLNPYARDRVTLSVKAVFGRQRDPLALIEGVEMFGGIYPAGYQALAYRPVGKARVRNVSEKPVHAKVAFHVDRFMDAPTESPSVVLGPGEEAEISFSAVFNDRITAVPQMIVREGTVFLKASQADEYEDRMKTAVLIHPRNAWDGDVRKLRYFVTPDAPAVLRYTRDVLLRAKDSLRDVPRELENFHKARLLFNTFAGQLTYVHDPKLTSDHVQYPSETLVLRGGDCDDMTVCFSSLLNSIGISTAFVDVLPQDRPEASHVYLLFDTGLAPQYGEQIALNPKRYVIRANRKGEDTIWIPVESTVITRGFDEAWTTGARSYYEDVEIRLGIAKGWVQIVDVY